MAELKVGLPVRTADDEVIGVVKEFTPERFKVDVHFHPDYWLERTTIADVTADWVKLNVTKHRLIEVQEELPRPTMSGNLNA